MATEANRNDVETFYPASRRHWRQWLQKNHQKQQSVWLLCYKKNSKMPTISWSEAVDEALCFGWIDSKRKPLDEEKFIQYFCKRKSTGGWSKINKAKIQRLTAEGLMSKAGHDCIEAAKRNGSWSLLDEVEELIIPPDLKKGFRDLPNAKKYFSGLSRSNKRIILQWIALAKRDETRQKRINEVVKLANKNLKPKQFR